MTTTSVTAEDIAAARERIADVARHTPVLPSATLTDRVGASVALKAENLQRTGSFKVRGATNKLSALGSACTAGVVAGSAGNHAQALAHAARARGVPCEVFMPVGAPLSKVEGAEALGAKVVIGGDSVVDCLAAATERAEAAGMAVVHPFDDPDVIAGQGTLGLELLEDVPDLAKIVVPVGGGGLAAGVAIAVKSARPDVEVIGVQVDTCAAVADALRGHEVRDAPKPLTIADGIAVKRPGRVTLPLIREWVDEVVTVSDEEIAEAIVVLMERAKQVVEGAGAVGVAALISGRTAPAPEGETVAILSG
ncbi:MAG TPA: threonine/serine dehydratase, partial [Solirubrobacteraceae bacterium]